MIATAKLINMSSLRAPVYFFVGAPESYAQHIATIQHSMFNYCHAACTLDL